MLSPERCFLAKGGDWQGLSWLDSNSLDFLRAGARFGRMGLAGSGGGVSRKGMVGRVRPEALAILFLRNLIDDD